MTGAGRSRAIVSYLGLIAYGEAYRLQLELVRRRTARETPDTLLLLEHPPTITIGRFGKTANVLASPRQLEAQGIGLVSSDRGGDVTYHGPGQLVAYPIIDLKWKGRDVHGYVHDLEEIAIQTLAGFGVEATRDPDHPGVFVDGQGIAAIGLRVKRRVTMHGLALNVSTELANFRLISPCGQAGRRATSLLALLGHEVPMDRVIDSFVGRFADVFGLAFTRQDMLNRCAR